MKIKMVRGYCGFLGGDDLVVGLGDVIDPADEVSSFLLLNGFAEEVDKSKPTPKKLAPKPKAKQK